MQKAYDEAIVHKQWKKEQGCCTADAQPVNQMYNNKKMAKIVEYCLHMRVADAKPG